MKKRSTQTLLSLAKLGFCAAVGALLSGVPANARADYASTVTNLNPLVYYRLNDAAAPSPTDGATNLSSLGAAANGFYLGVPGLTFTHPVTTGLIGGMTGAASFGGGYAAMPWLNSFNQQAFAAEMWFNALPLVSALCTSVNFDGRYGWIVYYGASGSDILELRMYNGNGSDYAAHITVSTPVSDSTWHHLVVQSDGTNAMVYIDGALAGTNALSGYAPVTANHAAPFVVFSRPDANPSYIAQGTAAQVAIYSNALTAAQILNHWNTGTNSSPSTNYQTVVLSDGALAYWPLNDGAFTAPDPSTYPVAINSGTLGPAANGTYLPGATPGAAGPGFAGLTGGGACHFNGIGSGYLGADLNLPGYIDLSAAGGIDSATITTAITVMAWVQHDAYVNQWTMFVGKGDSAWRLQRGASLGIGADIQWGLNANNPPTYTFFGISGGQVNITDNLWHQIVGVYDGTNASLYIDGALDSSVASPGFTIGSTSDLASIGTDSDNQGRVWDGSVAEVAIFNTGLTAAQVAQVYNSADAPPAIMVQPEITPPVYAGFTVSMAVQAIGAAPLSYQWTSNTVNLTGQTGTNLTLAGVTPAYAATYAVVVSNAYGSVTSTPVTLSIQDTKPLIFQQPASLSLAAGGTAAFTVVAGGTTPISYQWFLNSNAIPGATGATLVVAPVLTNEFGTYTVLLSNSLGLSNSLPAVLTQVFPPNYYAAEVMALNPYTYYLLNSTNGGLALDIGAGFNGTIEGNMALGAGASGAGFGGAHSAFQFDGSTTYVDCGTNVILDSVTRSIVIWFESGQIDYNNETGWLPLVTQGINSWRLQQWWFTSQLEDTDTGFNPPSFESSKPIDDSQWHMVAAVLDHGTRSLYFDGVLDQSALGVGPAPSTLDPVFIGSLFGYTDRVWPGMISDLAMFNHSLSASDVASLYAAAQNNPTPLAIVVQPAAQEVKAGDPVTLAVVATGPLPLAYQWSKGGSPIPGATSGTLTIPSAASSDSGSYDVVVTGGDGSSLTSQSAALAVLAPATFANLASLTDGLVLHLKFDGDFSDSSGNSNNGTAGGSPTFVPGKIGAQAVHVNTDPGSGTFNYVSVAESSSIALLDTNDFTVSYWVRYTGYPNDLPIIGNAHGSTYNAGWVMTDHTGKPEWTLTDVVTGEQWVADPVVFGPPTDDGAWHNEVFSFDRSSGSRANTYVDGVLVDSRSIPLLNNLDTGNGIILGQDPTGTYPVAGAYDIDDVGIWQRALTAYEVSTVFSAGQNGRSFDSSGGEMLTLRVSATNVELTWQAGTLMWAASLNGPWAPVLGASAPYYQATAEGTAKFFRVQP